MIAPSGVPQGACLSPLLYAIFVLDFSSALPEGTRCFLFANDVKTFAPVRSEESHLELQRAATEIADCCSWSAMALSTSKCLVLQHGRADLSYHIDGAVLPVAGYTRDFGVIVSADLRFDEHVLPVTRSCKTLIHSIFRCFVIKNPDVYIKLFRSVALPMLLYGAPVWRAHLGRHRQAIDGVQRLFVKKLS